ncbi:MAG TPA: MBL fold metallo-hydrolase [Ktedonobacterales bacterium]|jgi:glyoxylase-like metal-dependent hydrolase (beta-lactamase superfamily II)|nr:MBL fold metallo-hydrolase [Ktedonobacterales bacterium]
MTEPVTRVKRLAPDLWLLDTLFQGEQGVIASYLLTGADGLALVDVGSAATLDTLLASIRATGHQPEEIEHILLTHIHLDHAGATGALLPYMPQARVYVHHIGAPHLINPEKLISSASRIYGDKMHQLWGDMEPVPEERISLLDEGVETRVGGRTLRALYTPGHAIHHVAFHDAAHGDLFPGDVAGVRLEDIDYVRPPTPPPDLNLEDWSASIERLRALRPQTLYLPHFGPTPGSDRHFDELHDRLYAWGDIVARGMRQGENDQQLAADLAAASDPDVAQIASAGGAETDDTVTRYELATNYLMSAQGYMRYYKKTHPEALTE